MPADTRRRSTPSIRKPETIAALRRALASAGYTYNAVRAALDADETLSILPQQVPLVARRLGDGPLAILIRLFIFGAPVTMEQATHALAPLSVQDAVALGVVGVGRARVHAAVRLLPTEDGVFASDLDSADPTDLPADFVMGITDSSRLLARLTIRRPIELALDLGTGCGYQAVLAARHAERVIATDVNPRALAFTSFNALLNGATNVECRQGDRFAAVDGLLFDLVVSNPPFVISPDRSFVYRDSGLAGDQVSREIVQATPRCLRPDGLASVLVSWVHDPDEEWSAPLRDWLAESGCDAWLLRKGSYDPLAYAVMWNQRLALANQLDRYLASVDRWTRYFERLSIRAMGYGAVLLRRRGASAGARVRTDELPEKGLASDAAVELERLLLVEDGLETIDDIALLDFKIGLAPEHRLEQVLHWRDGGFRTLEATLFRDRGLQPRAEVDAPLAALLAHIDGTRTIADVLTRTAQAIAPEQDPAVFQAQALEAVRELVAHGFLVLQR